jgi:hypothetical protein
MRHDTHIRIEEPGAYLFRAPVKCYVELNREILVTLSAPSQEVTAIAYWKPTQPPRELLATLETLFQRLVAHGADKQRLEARVTGASDGASKLSRGLADWLREHGVPVVAADVGRGVCRTVHVDCANGRIGVSYSESIVPTDAPLLTQGTARRRPGGFDTETPPEPVLLLCANTVQRTLVRQAIEGMAGFRCIAPAVPEAQLSEDAQRVARRVVLVADALPSVPLRTWYRAWRESHADGILAISGKAPRTVLGDVALPPVSPETITAFKDALYRYLHRTEAKPGTALGTVLPFSKRRQPKKPATRKPKSKR